MLITQEELLSRLSKTRKFDVDRFICGPKGPSEMVTQVNERETDLIIIPERGIARTARLSIRWLFLYEDLLLGEDMRVRKCEVIQGPKEQTGSGTAQKGEPHFETIIRELFGNDVTPGEMPQLKALLDALGIQLCREHMDFIMYARWNVRSHEMSSVFRGFESIVFPYYVAIDLKKLGLKKLPWPNGTVAYDLGTFIPLSWRKKPDIRLLSHSFEDYLHAMHPLEEEFPASWEDWIQQIKLQDGR